MDVVEDAERVSVHLLDVCDEERDGVEPETQVAAGREVAEGEGALPLLRRRVEGLGGARTRGEGEECVVVLERGLEEGLVSVGI